MNRWYVPDYSLSPSQCVCGYFRPVLKGREEEKKQKLVGFLSEGFSRSSSVGFSPLKTARNDDVIWASECVRACVLRAGQKVSPRYEARSNKRKTPEIMSGETVLVLPA